jgi:hypothetical protein
MKQIMHELIAVVQRLQRVSPKSLSSVVLYARYLLEQSETAKDAEERRKATQTAQVIPFRKLSPKRTTQDTR